LGVLALSKKFQHGLVDRLSDPNSEGRGQIHVLHISQMGLSAT